MQSVKRWTPPRNRHSAPIELDADKAAFTSGPSYRRAARFALINLAEYYLWAAARQCRSFGFSRISRDLDCAGYKAKARVLLCEARRLRVWDTN